MPVIDKGVTLDRLKVLSMFCNNDYVRLDDKWGLTADGESFAESFLFQDGLGNEEPFAVSLSKFYQLVNNMDTDEIKVQLSGNELRLDGKRVRGGLKVYEPFDISWLPKFGKKAKKLDIPEGFWAAVSLACTTASKNTVWPVLMNVHITKEYVEATDNVRVARKKLTEPFEADLDLLIPARLLRNICRVPNLVLMVLDDGPWVVFKGMGMRIGVQRYDGDYVPLDGVVDYQGDAVAFRAEQTKALMQGLKKVANFCGKSQVDAGHLQIKVSDSTMTVRGESEAGWFEEDFELGAKFEPFSISFTLEQFLKFTEDDFDEVELMEGMMRFKKADQVFVVNLT